MRQRVNQSNFGVDQDIGLAPISFPAFLNSFYKIQTKEIPIFPKHEMSSSSVSISQTMFSLKLRKSAEEPQSGQGEQRDWLHHTLPNHFGMPLIIS